MQTPIHEFDWFDSIIVIVALETISIISKIQVAFFSEAAVIFFIT